MSAPTTIDQYVATLPDATRAAVAEMVRRFRLAAPGADEAIRYQMPAFRLANGRPVYVAGWAKHVSLHDVPPLPAALEAVVGPLRSGKDTVRFPVNRPVPYDLVEEVVAAVAAMAPLDAGSP